MSRAGETSKLWRAEVGECVKTLCTGRIEVGREAGGAWVGREAVDWWSLGPGC